MKAMIFAAGLGSRLKPITDTRPKALVTVGGKTMLEHIILKLKAAGFDEIVINVHHFSNQILAFLEANQNFGVNIQISSSSIPLFRFSNISSYGVSPFWSQHTNLGRNRLPA